MADKPSLPTRRPVKKPVRHPISAPKRPQEEKQR